MDYQRRKLQELFTLPEADDPNFNEAVKYVLETALRDELDEIRSKVGGLEPKQPVEPIIKYV